MFYSVEDITEIYLDNFIIKPALYQQEYDYNSCIERIIVFLQNYFKSINVTKIEMIAPLKGEEVNEREILLELYKKIDLTSLNQQIEKDFTEAICYWKYLYSLEDNFDTF